VRHDKECGHYPQSLTKVFEDRIHELEAENAALREGKAQGVGVKGLVETLKSYEGRQAHQIMPAIWPYLQAIVSEYDAALTPAPVSDHGDQCDCCGRNYRTVYRVPNDLWAQIAPRPDTLGPHPEHQGGGLLCSDRAVFLTPSRKGTSQMISIARIKGWHFDTDNRWRCPDHSETTTPAPETEGET
jgi:hypothetical protein